MERSWTPAKSRSETRSSASVQIAKLAQPCGFAALALRAARRPPAQQEHCLLAKQVPGPPWRVEAQRPPRRIERHRLFHLRSRHRAKLTEILDGAEMNVGRVPPGIGQVVGARHVSSEHDLHPNLPVPEIGKRHDPVATDTQ